MSRRTSPLLRTARQVAERMSSYQGRTVRIGHVEGALTGAIESTAGVTLALVVGGARAWFPLEPDAEIEVSRGE